MTASDNETFRLGGDPAFEVVQNNVAEAVIDAPAGWTAVLGETTLTVKAPRRSTPLRSRRRSR